MEANQSPINSLFHERNLRRIIFKINTDEIIENRRKNEGSMKEICKIIKTINCPTHATANKWVGVPFYHAFFEIHWNYMPYAYDPETRRGLYL